MGLRSLPERSVGVAPLLAMTRIPGQWNRNDRPIYGFKTNVFETMTGGSTTYSNVSLRMKAAAKAQVVAPPPILGTVKTS